MSYIPQYIQNPMMNPYSLGATGAMQQRLQSLEMQQATPQGAGYQSQPRPVIKSFPVASLEEAKAAIIEFNGSIFIFYNIQNGEIYTKQLNINTGFVDFRVYKLTDSNNNKNEQAITNQQVVPAVTPGENVQPSKKYVTKEDLDIVLDELTKLRNELDTLKGGTSNVPESNATV